MRDINNASQVPVSALTMCVLYAQALCQFPTTVNPASLWWVARVGPGQGSAVLKASVDGKGDVWGACWTMGVAPGMGPIEPGGPRERSSCA